VLLAFASEEALAGSDDHTSIILRNSTNSHWGQSFDRSFAREWEKHPPRGYPTISERNIGPLKAAIKRYAAIVAKGGWNPLPRVKLLKTGDSGKAVIALRRRLEVTGDLKHGSMYASFYDSYVEKAVKEFQKRHGLTPTGAVDKPTRLALNVPASSRLRQLRKNLSRLASLSNKTDERYVMVNIPAAQIEAVENDRVVSRHSAVVGKVDRKTPILQSRVHEINFNPYWTIPRSIVRKDLTPAARKSKSVMKKFKIRAYDTQGREVKQSSINWHSGDADVKYTFRQEPYSNNSMGFVKINFHNKHAVFMHDTPSKSLFGKNYRAYSSGCVRVQNVQQLVAWMLKSNDGWSRKRIAEIKRSGERSDVRLKKKVPVYFSYLTAWATPNGTVNFRRDIYRRDQVSKLASSY
jgi:murein L,D-transpeptidase YcbB/YkuD